MQETPVFLGDMQYEKVCFLSISSATGLGVRAGNIFDTTFDKPMAGFILYLTSLDLMRD